MNQESCNWCGVVVDARHITTKRKWNNKANAWLEVYKCPVCKEYVQIDIYPEEE